MSLIERVRIAGNDDTDQVLPTYTHLLSSLKEQLHAKISTEEIARLIQTNPLRAKNEIRSICASILDNDSLFIDAVSHKDQLIEETIDAVMGLGPLEALLADEEITEIMVNGTHSLFVEKCGILRSGSNTFASEEQLRSVIDRVISPIGRRVDESSPMVNARLEQGHRINVIIPPLSLDGPVITIRKFGERVLTLQGIISGKVADDLLQPLLEWSVLMRKNIAVSGGTGSGKTTLLNALSNTIPHSERIITIEDSAELRFLEHPHVVRLEARPRNAEGVGEITIRDLVINALRMRPDRIVVGECRGGEALDMLQAMNTGHDGSLTTLHANSTQESITRLTTMVRYVAELPIEVIEQQIASALDLVVQMIRDVKGNRYISQIAEMRFNKEARRCEAFEIYSRRTSDVKGTWHSAPSWIDEVAKCGIASNKEVEAWKRSILPF